MPMSCFLRTSYRCTNNFSFQLHNIIALILQKKSWQYFKFLTNCWKFLDKVLFHILVNFRKYLQMFANFSQSLQNFGIFCPALSQSFANIHKFLRNFANLRGSNSLFIHPIWNYTAFSAKAIKHRNQCGYLAHIIYGK